MKKGRYSEEQIIAVLKEHPAGIPVADSCRREGTTSRLKSRCRTASLRASTAASGTNEHLRSLPAVTGSRPAVMVNPLEVPTSVVQRRGAAQNENRVQL